MITLEQRYRVISGRESARERRMLVDILKMQSSRRIDRRAMQDMRHTHFLEREEERTKMALSKYLMDYITCTRREDERGDIILTAIINMPVIQDDYFNDKLYSLKRLIKTPWYQKVYWFFVDSIRYDQYLRAIR